MQQQLSSNQNNQLNQNQNQQKMIKGAARLINYDKPTIWTKFGALAAESQPANLGQGFPSWNPPEFFMQALNDVNKNTSQQYTRAYGTPNLTNSIAQFYSPIFGRDLDPNTNILVANGGVACLNATFMSMINPGDEVILLDPSYDCYAAQIQMAGGVAKSVPLQPKVMQSQEQVLAKENRYEFTENDSWEINWELLSQTFNSKTRAIVINSPHNPTGKIFTNEEYLKIAELVKQNEQCFVVEDQVYEHLTFETCQPFQLPRMAKIEGMFDRCVNISSAGKLFSATGIRVGWAIGPSSILKNLQGFHQYNVFCMHGPTQDAVASALDQSRTNGYFDKLNNDMIVLRNLLIDQILGAKDKLNLWIPQGGYFIIAGIHNLEAQEKYYKHHLFTDRPILKDLAFSLESSYEKGVQPIPCSFFYQPEYTKMGENLVRYAFCKDKETIELAGQRLARNSKN